MHFYGANGFPSGVYQPLLAHLSGRYAVSTLHMRPTWEGEPPPPGRRDWGMYAEDLIAYLDQQVQTPVVATAHSMGATATVLAAVARPDLFRALVLIEPAMVDAWLAALLRFVPKWLATRMEPAKSTLTKTHQWTSRQGFLEEIQSFRPYKRFPPETFEAFAQSAVRDRPDGKVELVFDKIWEAHNYSQPPNIMAKLQSLQVPCVAIRGKPSVFFSHNMWRAWQNHQGQTLFKENLDFGHLYPLESPESCAHQMLEGLAELGY